MSIEDFSLQAFQTQITAIVTQYFTSHPEDLYNAALRNRIIEAITQSLEGQQYQKDSLDESISHTFYFGSLCRVEDSGDEAIPHLFMNGSINQDGGIEIMSQVKQENHAQTRKKRQNHDEIFYPEEENEQKIAQIIDTSQFVKKEGRIQSSQCLEGEMMDQATIKCENFIQMRKKRYKRKDESKKILFEKDEFSHNESQTFEHNSNQFHINRKKNRLSSKLFRNIETSIKRQAKNLKKSQSRKPCFPQMEQILINWIKINCQRSIVVSQYEIRKEAMRILQKLDKSKHPYFRASKGWLEKFFKRNMEVYQILSRERHKSHINTDCVFGLL